MSCPDCIMCQQYKMEQNDIEALVHQKREFMERQKVFFQLHVEQEKTIFVIVTWKNAQILMLMII